MLAGLAHGLALQSSGPLLPQDLAHGLALQSSGPLLPQDLARKAPYADQDLYKINQVQNYAYAGQGCSRHNKIMSCSMHVRTSKQNKYLSPKSQVQPNSSG